jgi:hypothetical protein
MDRTTAVCLLICVDQACQTGGPIACLMRPAAILSHRKIADNWQV